MGCLPKFVLASIESKRQRLPQHICAIYLQFYSHEDPMSALPFHHLVCHALLYIIDHIKEIKKKYIRLQGRETVKSFQFTSGDIKNSQIRKVPCTPFSVLQLFVREELSDNSFRVEKWKLLLMKLEQTQHSTHYHTRDQ